jgi:hypothetical protein
VASIGLYHPYIQFKSDAWLKLTALYWDEMARIVPAGFPLRDSDTVKELEDARFVSSRAPKLEELTEVAEAFAQLIATRGEELRKLYAVELKEKWPNDPVTVLTEPYGDRRLGYVYPTKMVDKLPKLLAATGLAEFGRSIPDIGLGMHPRLADVYMLALAKRIAQSTAFEPITDEVRNQVAMTGCDADVLADALLREVEVAAPTDGELGPEEFLLNLSFDTVIPNGLEHVPVKKIIEVRKRWEPERRRFHQGLQKIVDDMGEKAKVADADARMKHLNAAFETHVDGPLNDLRQQLSRANVDFGIGAFSCSTALPAATVGGVLLAGATPCLVGVGALALGVYKLLSGRRTKREELAKSNLSYLIRLEQDLKAEQLSSWIDERLRRFRFWQ